MLPGLEGQGDGLLLLLQGAVINGQGGLNCNIGLNDKIGLNCQCGLNGQSGLNVQSGLNGQVA